MEKRVGPSTEPLGTPQGRCGDVTENVHNWTSCEHFLRVQWCIAGGGGGCCGLLYQKLLLGPGGWVEMGNRHLMPSGGGWWPWPRLFLCDGQGGNYTETSQTGYCVWGDHDVVLQLYFPEPLTGMEIYCCHANFTIGGTAIRTPESILKLSTQKPLKSLLQNATSEKQWLQERDSKALHGGFQTFAPPSDACRQDIVADSDTHCASLILRMNEGNEIYRPHHCHRGIVHLQIKRITINTKYDRWHPNDVLNVFMWMPFNYRALSSFVKVVVLWLQRWSILIHQLIPCFP